MHLRKLKISTNILLHSGFYKAPYAFARRKGLKLAGDVYPETSFKTNADTKEKVSKVKANIHLVSYKAIRLFTERNNEGDWIRSIDLNPSLLRYGDNDHPLAESDLTLVLSMLKANVTPLLANPLDERHIVPGLADDLSAKAYWSAVKSEVLLRDVRLRCLHDMSHPATLPAEGVSKKRIELCGHGVALVICFEKANWKVTGPHGRESVRGVRVSLRLAGPPLLARYGPTCTTVLLNNTRRLSAFRLSDVARVHDEAMSQLEGTCLPVPPEWAHMGDPVTHAKTMALVSKMTSIPLEDLRAMDKEIRHPSKSTRTRLNKDVPEALACLKPIPVSELFHESVYAAGVSEATPYPDDRIDPLVAAVYG